MTETDTWGGLTAPMAVRGSVAGAVAFVLGYLLAYLTAADVAQVAARGFEPLANAGGRFVPAWKAAGWAFLDAHFVGTTFPGGAVNQVSMASVDFLYLIPIGLLLVAGGGLAYRDASGDPRRGTIVGMTVVFGYLPLAVLFSVLTQHANVRPSLLRALVVAGLLYPVAFGAIGGVLAAVADSENE